MKPIYFPFTYLPADVMGTLGVFFSQIAVYQPSDLPIPEEMAAWAQSGKLTVRIPLNAGSANLAQAAKAYRVWAAQHQGSELAFFKTAKDAIPFYDESSVHEIRSEIRHKQDERNRITQPSSEADGLLMQARLFLQMAQEFDAEQWAIRHSLNTQAAMERDMMKSLQGETEAADPQAGPEATADSGRPGDYMIAARMAAWRSLMRFDPEVSGIFVTDNQEALAALVDDRPEIVEVGRWVRPSVPSSETDADWQTHFDQYLQRLATEAWPIAWPDRIAPPPPGSTGDGATLTLYLAVAQEPQALFKTGGVPPVSEGTEACPGAARRNTVIALVASEGRPRSQS
jgi:hypothetical protein